MNITTFADRLAKTVEDGLQPSAAGIRSETDFERQYVVKPAWKLAVANPDIFLCVHPEPGARCAPDCSNTDKRVRGCKQCWKDSKAWSVVQAYGLRHTFDLAARDSKERKLAVEVKWIRFNGGRGPNGEFQRFIGQCVLASAHHDAVVGICGVSGKRDREFDLHTSRLKRKLRKAGVRLVVLHARG